MESKILVRTDVYPDLVDIETLLEHFQLDLIELESLMYNGHIFPTILKDRFGGYEYIWSIKEFQDFFDYVDRLAEQYADIQASYI